MAMAVHYTNFDDRLLHENRGGTIAPYVPDTLGSVAAVLPSSSLSPFQATYWPYGEVNTSSGTNPSPWAFVGTLGYYVDVASVSTYVRARFYKPATAQWLTSDPIWPRQATYAYGLSNPVSLVDWLGMDGCQQPTPDPCGGGKTHDDCKKCEQSCSRAEIPYSVQCPDGTWFCTCCTRGATIQGICAGHGAPGAPPGGYTDTCGEKPGGGSGGGGGTGGPTPAPQPPNLVVTGSPGQHGKPPSITVGVTVSSACIACLLGCIFNPHNCHCKGKGRPCGP